MVACAYSLEHTIICSHRRLMNAYLQAFFHADCLGTEIVSLLTQFDTHIPCMSICVQQLAKRPPGSDFQLFNVTPCRCEGSANAIESSRKLKPENGFPMQRSARLRIANKKTNTKNRSPEMDCRCCSQSRFQSRFSRSSTCDCGKTPLTYRLCETAKHNVTHLSARNTASAFRLYSTLGKAR